MRPYFETPIAGGVLLVVVLCWLLLEFAEFLRVQAARASRTGATKTRSPGGFWVTVACLAAAEACLYGAPHVFPAAAIRPGGPLSARRRLAGQAGHREPEPAWPHPGSQNWVLSSSISRARCWSCA
jgi:hypothetical protein